MALLETLEELSAVQSGHFILSSGLHSDTYIQCARLFEHPDVADRVCEQFAELLPDKDVDAVVGPAMGGVVFAYALARVLGCRAVFAERVDGEFTLRRGFHLEPGSKIYVAEDVVTTGKSVNELLGSLRKIDVDVRGIAAVVQRAESNPFDLPLYPLMQVRPKVYDPVDCPLCAEGTEAVKPGSRGLKA